MDRKSRVTADRRLGRLQDTVLALTRYVVDADPHRLAAISAEDVLSITDYALAIRQAGIEPGEKVKASGSRNLLGHNLAEWQAEMLAVAAGASTMTHHIVHIILSLHEDETWTQPERDEAIEVVLQTLKLERCQAIWAEHSNTRHPHLHIAVLRVDPTSGKATGTDWLIDDLHQALALVEERQSRAVEPNALYVARNGAVFDAETGVLVRHADGSFVSKWWEAEGKKRTRLPDPLRAVRGAIVEAATAASSWADFHENITAFEVTYDKAGSGAHIALGKYRVKASELHVSLSRPELEKRFGEFQPDAGRARHPFDRYRLAVQKQVDTLRRHREVEVAAIDHWVGARLAEVPSSQHKLLGPLIREEGRQATKAIQAAFAEAIRRSTSQRMTLDRWEAGGQPASPSPVSIPTLLTPPLSAHSEESAADVSRYEKDQRRFSTAYKDERGRTLFTDHRAFIIVQATEEVAAIDEALALAAARWGVVRLFGDGEIVELAATRAKALGIEVTYVLPEPTLARQEQSSEPVLVQRPQEEPAKTIRPRSAAEVQEVRVHRAIAVLERMPELAIRRREAAGDDLRSGRTGSFEIVLKRQDHCVEDAIILDQHPLVQQFLQRRHAAMIDGWAVEIERRCDGPLPFAEQEVLAIIPTTGDNRYLAEVASRDAEFLAMRRDLVFRLKDRPARSPTPPSSEESRSTPKEEAASVEPSFEEIKAQKALLERLVSNQRG